MPEDIQDILRSHFLPKQEKPDHHYRTEIPNIIFDLNLDPYEFKLYCIIKKIAGDESGCWKSNSNISKECEISSRKIQEALKKLSSPFELLNGQALITIIPRKKEDGSPDTNLLIINDIWRFNGDHNRKNSKGGTASCAGGVVHDARGGGAPYAHKEDPLNKIPPKNFVCMAAPDLIKIKDRVGKEQGLAKQDIFLLAVKSKLDWTTPEIENLYDVLAKYDKPINDLIGFCRTVIDKKRKEQRAEKFSKKDKEKSTLSSNAPPFNGEKATRNFMDVLNERLNEKAGV